MHGSRPRALARARTIPIAAFAALSILLAACGTPPDQDPFYKPPAPLPAGSPGDIIRSRVSTFGSGTQAWHVLYRSESALGAPIAISGMIIVPTAAWTGAGTRPLITYGVGTRGIGDGCAPSYTLTNGTDYEGGTIKKALDKGWAVAVSDMEGLGTPGMHTYEVGKSQGRALLNIARAAERLSGTGLNTNTPVGIMGYSQGGTSAGWAAELAPTYSPDLKVKGVAAGGVPADLNAVASNLDGSAFFAFELFAAVGLDAAYPELDLKGYLNEAGTKLYNDMQNICLVSVDVFSGVLNTAFKHVTDFTTSNPLITPAWQARLNENKLGSGKPNVPVFQYHALLDEIIPLAQAQTLRQTWCAKGVNVTWKTFGIAEHASAMLEGEQPALDFLSDRFAGTPVFGNCLFP